MKPLRLVSFSLFPHIDREAIGMAFTIFTALEKTIYAMSAALKRAKRELLANS